MKMKSKQLPTFLDNANRAAGKLAKLISTACCIAKTLYDLYQTLGHH